MEDCIFCKIANNEIPATKVFEDDDFLAFMEIKPVAPGHILVVPKLHSSSIFELHDELVGKYLVVAKRIARAMQAGLECRKVAIAVWGEDVAHAHLHLIPRYDGDGLEFWKQHKAEKDDLEIKASKVIDALD